MYCDQKTFLPSTIECNLYLFCSRSQPTQEKVGPGPGTNEERPEYEGPAGMAPEGEIEVRNGGWGMAGSIADCILCHKLQ